MCKQLVNSELEYLKPYDLEWVLSIKLDSFVFNGISTFMGHLIIKVSLEKNSSVAI